MPPLCCCKSDSRSDAPVTLILLYIQILKGFLSKSRAKLEEQLSQQNVEGYDYMRITFIYKFLRSHTNCFMEGLSPIFSDYKLVRIIDMATYEIDAGVTQMKQKQIKT